METVEKEVYTRREKRERRRYLGKGQRVSGGVWGEDAEERVGVFEERGQRKWKGVERGW